MRFSFQDDQRGKMIDADGLPMFSNENAFQSFEWSLRQQDRTEEVEGFLAGVLATVKSRRRRLPQGALLFRAQRGYVLRTDDDIDTGIPDAFPPGRMKPLRDQASEGRVNRKNIPCLYLAEHGDTAMAEVRPWVGAKITLAQFKVVRDCIIVDCSQDKLTSLDLMLRKSEATAEECEQAVWGDISRAFSTPLTRDDTLEEYLATQCVAERFRSEGYDGVAFPSALGKGRSFALFDLDAACPMNGTLYNTESVSYKFEKANNTYYIPKHYPELAQSVGVDPTSVEAESPCYMRIVAFRSVDAKDESDETVEDSPEGSTL
jgi:hypothetical protein